MKNITNTPDGINSHALARDHKAINHGGTEDVFKTSFRRLNGSRVVFVGVAFMEVFRDY